MIISIAIFFKAITMMTFILLLCKALMNGPQFKIQHHHRIIKRYHPVSQLEHKLYAKPKQYERIVYIRASEVAAIIGKNRFKSKEEIFDVYWERYFDETYADTSEVIELDEYDQNILKQALVTNVQTSSDVIDIIQRTELTIRETSVLGLQEQEVLIEFMKSEINKNYGTKSESKTAKKIEQEQGISLQIDDKLYKKKIHDYHNICFYLVGKVDRIEQQVNGENELIEIKNRVKRLFKQLYDYENIQIQCYFQLLPKSICKGKLIEQFNELTHTIPIQRDDVLWKTFILPELKKFAIELVDKACLSNYNNNEDDDIES